MSNKQVWKFLYKYIKQAKYMVLLLLMMFLAASFLMRMQNYIIAEMIGILSNAQNYPDIGLTLTKYLISLAMILFVLSAGDGLRRIVEAYFVPSFNAKVAKDLFVMTHKHSIRFFEEELSGNISGKVKNILTNVENMYMHILFGIVMPVMEMGMCLAFIAFVDVHLALLIGVVNFLFLTANLYYRKQIVPYSAITSKLGAAANGVFVDTVTNSVLVKSFANYFKEKHTFFKAIRESAIAKKKEFIKIAKLSWLSKTSFDLMFIISYSIVFYFWYKYSLSIADVVLVTSLFTSLTGAIRNMGYMASNFAQVFGSIKDGLELLNKPCDVVDKPNAKKMKIQTNDVMFDKVLYTYKNNKTLFKNFSLQIEANKKIGLVGHSGAGKSTLIKLLSRYYDVLGGKILIGGIDIASVTQESLRKHIALIPQESTLFNRSIKLW